MLVGEAETRTVRADRRGDRAFAEGAAPGTVSAGGVDRAVTEDALVAPDGTRLARLPGHVSYWFAWDGYLGL